jgi:tetratricopeptide (TPR) repeat protein
MAVAEYERLVREEPHDWSTAIHLGTLYLRAGFVDKALEQLTKVSDAMYDEKLLSEAASLYATVLTIRKGNEHALLRSAEIASMQGQIDEARAHFTALEKVRSGRGDTRGAAEIRVRLGALDPRDLNARVVAAQARRELGEVHAAVAELRMISAELNESGRHADALSLLEQAVSYAPDDKDVRALLFATYIQAGDFSRARQAASTPQDWRLLAVALAKADHPEAVNALREAVRLNPADTAVRARLAAQYVGLGDAVGAAEYLLPEMAGRDAALLVVIAEIQLRASKIDNGVDTAKRALAMDPSLGSLVADLAARAGAHLSEAAWPLLECVVDELTSKSDWQSAASHLQHFIRRVPNCIPALVRLVEVAIDGGLEGTASKAQALLADSYLANGMGAEALVVIEDLTVREPGNQRHMDRLRRALTISGEENPDEAIARRLTVMTLPDFNGQEAEPDDASSEERRVLLFGSPAPVGRY